MTEVKLATYDVSRGVARGLSKKYLGTHDAVNIIPHSTILVFGKEYYYGREGLRSVDPIEFRSSIGMDPIDIIPLGHSTVSQHEFDAWCAWTAHHPSSGKDDKPRFGASSYDFLHHNCNTFSNDVALEGLRLSQGVPKWYMDIPKRFISSSCGSAIKPILEKMHLDSTQVPDVKPAALAPATVTAVAAVSVASKSLAPEPAKHDDVANNSAPTILTAHATPIANTGLARSDGAMSVSSSSKTPPCSPWAIVATPVGVQSLPPVVPQVHVATVLPSLPSNGTALPPLPSNGVTSSASLREESKEACISLTATATPIEYSKSLPDEGTYHVTAQVTSEIPATSSMKLPDAMDIITRAPSASTANLSLSRSASANPWAEMTTVCEEPATSNTLSMEDPEPRTLSEIESTKQAEPISTPVLDSFCDPIVSNDIKSIPLCIMRISGSLRECCLERETTVIADLGKLLIDCSLKAARKEEKDDESGYIPSYGLETLEKALTAIHDIFLNPDKDTILEPASAPTITSCLMMLRLVVLQFPTHRSVLKCIDWIEQEFANEKKRMDEVEEEKKAEEDEEDGKRNSRRRILEESSAARFMAWCVLGNFLSCRNFAASTDLIDCAVRDMNPDGKARLEVRKAAACFLYNLALAKQRYSNGKEDGDSDNDDDILFSMLVASLDNIYKESDQSIRLRRFLIAGRTVIPFHKRSTIRPFNKSVQQLLSGLGIHEILEDIASNDDATANTAVDTPLSQELAVELLQLISTAQE